MSASSFPLQLTSSSLIPKLKSNKSKFYIEKTIAQKKRNTIIQKYDIKKSIFNELQIYQLTLEFYRLSDLDMKYNKKLLSKDIFLNFFLKCNDVNNNEGKMAKYIVDSIYNLYDIENKNGLEYCEYIGVCELFINGTLQERLEFFYKSSTIKNFDIHKSQSPTARSNATLISNSTLKSDISDLIIGFTSPISQSQGFSKAPVSKIDEFSEPLNLTKSFSFLSYDDSDISLAAVPRLQQFINNYSFCSKDSHFIKEYKVADFECSYFNLNDIAGVRLDEYAQFEHIVNAWRNDYDSFIPVVEINDSNHNFENLFHFIAAKNFEEVQHNYNKFIDKIIYKLNKLSDFNIISKELTSKIMDSEFGISIASSQFINIFGWSSLDKLLSSCKLIIPSNWEDNHSSLTSYNLARFESLTSMQKALVLIIFCLQENCWDLIKQSTYKLWIFAVFSLQRSSNGAFLISRTSMHNFLNELSYNFLTNNDISLSIEDSLKSHFAKEHMLIDIICCELNCNKVLSSSDDLELQNPSHIYYLIKQWNIRRHALDTIKYCLYDSNCIGINAKTLESENSEIVKEGGTIQSQKELPFYKTTFFRIIFLLSIILVEAAVYFIIGILSISTAVALHFNVTVGDMGFFGSLNTIGWIISLFTTQVLIQKFGMTIACLINLLIQSVGCILFLFASYQASFPILEGGMFLIGIGDVYLIVNLLVAKYFGDMVGVAFSVVAVFYNITTAVASVAFPYLNSAYSMNFLFWMICLSNLLSLLGLAAVFLLSKSLPEEFSISDSAWSKILAKLKELKAVVLNEDSSIPTATGFDYNLWKLGAISYVFETKSSMVSLLYLSLEQPLTFWVFLLYMLFCYGCCITPIAYVSNYFIEAGYSQAEGSFFSYFLINMLSLLVSPIFGYMFDNFGKRFLLPFFLFCFQILAILILDKTSAHPIVFPFLYVSAFAIIRIFGFPLLPLIVNENFLDYSATLFMVFCGCGSTFFYIITGSILKQHGYPSLWVFCYGASSVTIILLGLVYLADQYSDKRGELHENIKRVRLLIKTRHF